MTGVQVRGTGTSVDLVIANMREQLDEQFGEGEWVLEDEGEIEMVNPYVSIELSQGGQIASVVVEMRVRGARLSTAALPRAEAK